MALDKLPSGKPVLGAAALTMLLTAPGCQRHSQPPVRAAEPAPVEVRVLRVTARPFAATVAITGTLVSRSRVEVKAETTGRVVRFPKEEGDRVVAGEPVLWVNEEPYRLAVQQAETSVHVAAAALERARIVEAHARSELERARNLVRSGGITDRDLKAAELAERDAGAQVALAVAQLEQARAALAVARKRLDDTVVRAPVAGEIQSKLVNVGAYVEPHTPVFTLVDNGRLELHSRVPSHELALIRPGQRVTFTVAAYAERVFEGRVLEISPAVDPQSRSAKVRIQVLSPGGALKDGMFAQGEVWTEVERRRIVVPSSAVQRSDAAEGEAFVYVISENQAVRRAVRVGRERNREVEILEGLREDELLVAEPGVEIRDGVPVTPRLAAARAASER
ncbi:MAG: efflux RND transporter periplasmic adaptor subunit [Bryobacterales bacterium]|nr:efflux RND transporter periplasmic adaptor subunit [Bryobacteraceae bacterium]MDW8353760.1 efflux RND transporter periplasmic adaptor subunit [Bryobacterales bacterium]